jgi:hypothetical protein
MIDHVSLDTLIDLAGGDCELVTRLIDEGVIEQGEHGFAPEQVDRVLVSCTLIRELEVNLAGVDIILRLRAELANARKRLGELEHRG